MHLDPQVIVRRPLPPWPRLQPLAHLPQGDGSETVLDEAVAAVPLQAASSLGFAATMPQLPLGPLARLYLLLVPGLARE